MSAEPAKVCFLCPYWGRLNLITRLMLGSILVVSIASVLLLSVLVSRDARLIKDLLQSELNDELDMLPLALAEDMLVGDFASIETKLKSHARQNNILRIALNPSNGNQIVATGLPVPLNIPVWFADVMRIKPMQGSRHIALGGKHYGEVAVEMGSTSLLNRSWTQLTTTLQIILVGLLLNSLLMYLILRGSLSPLQKLVEGEHKFAEGNLDTRLVEVGCPEVRQLITEFNLMAQQIEEQANKSALDARQLRESEHHFRTLANNASVLIWMSGTDKLCNYFNQVWLEFTGRSLEQELGNGWTQAVHPDDLQNCLDVYTHAFDQRQPFDMEYRLRRHDGEYRWLIDHGVPRYDIQGEFLGYVGSCLDITDRKQIEIDITNSLHALRTRDYALAQISQGVVITSPQRLITYVNDGFEKLTGYSAAELMGKSCSILQGKDTDPEAISNMRAALETVKPFRGVILNYHKDGTEFWNDLSITPVFDDQGVLSQFVSVQHDITAHKRDEEMIRQLAFFDSLTQLANRRLLNDRLDRAIALSKRSGCYGALIYLDLDNFKPLNDSCGHEVGDRLLIEVAARLKHSTREADTVARIGGDEFAVLLVELDPKLDASIKQTSIVAEKIRANIAEPYLLDLQPELGQDSQKVEHRCTSSIGVALFANDDHSQVELFRRADMAMYQAKQNGRNQIQFFTTVI